MQIGPAQTRPRACCTGSCGSSSWSYSWCASIGLPSASTAPERCRRHGTTGRTCRPAPHSNRPRRIRQCDCLDVPPSRYCARAQGLAGPLSRHRVVRQRFEGLPPRQREIRGSSERGLRRQHEGHPPPACRRAARIGGSIPTSRPAQSAHRRDSGRPGHGAAAVPAENCQRIAADTGHRRPRTGMAGCLGPGDPRAGRNVPYFGPVPIRRPARRYPRPLTSLRLGGFVRKHSNPKKPLAAPDRHSAHSLGLVSAVMDDPGHRPDADAAPPAHAACAVSG